MITIIMLCVYGVVTIAIFGGVILTVDFLFKVVPNRFTEAEKNHWSGLIAFLVTLAFVLRWLVCISSKVL